MKIEYIRFIGKKDDEAHLISVDINTHKSNIIVYYKNNLYSFTQIGGGDDIISNEIFNQIKEKLDNTRKNVENKEKSEEMIEEKINVK